MSRQRITNLADLALKDNGNGKSFQAKIARAGRQLGLTAIGCTLVVVPPGKRAWPFHRHHVADELFYVLSGSGEVRLDGEARPIRAGDLIASPAGAEAHQIANTSSQELRYLAISNIESVDIIEYPDSGKIGAAAGIRNADRTTATIAKLGRVQEAGYFDGEEPA
jgi:uncharacterized cupin superfamily protein